MINSEHGNVQINISNVAQACTVPSATAEYKTDLYAPVIFIAFVCQLQA
jgi:hypothetical protein